MKLVIYAIILVALCINCKSMVREMTTEETSETQFLTNLRLLGKLQENLLVKIHDILGGARFHKFKKGLNEYVDDPDLFFKNKGTLSDKEKSELMDQTFVEHIEGFKELPYDDRSTIFDFFNVSRHIKDANNVKNRKKSIVELLEEQNSLLKDLKRKGR